MFYISGIKKGTARQFLRKHFLRGKSPFQCPPSQLSSPENPPVPSLRLLLLLGCQNISHNEAVWPEATITSNTDPAERGSGSMAGCSHAVSLELGYAWQGKRDKKEWILAFTQPWCPWRLWKRLGKAWIWLVQEVVVWLFGLLPCLLVGSVIW